MAGRGQVDKYSSGAPNTLASTVCFVGLLAVQSIFSAPAETTFSVEVAANSSTQPRKVSTSVEGREGALKVVQSPMAQSNTSKASESYF